MARRRKPIDEDLDDEFAKTPARARKPRRRGRFLLLMVALGALVAAGPSIVAKTPLRDVLLSSAVAPSAGRLSAVDAAFSWTGGQGLAGVALLDPNGAVIFNADLVTVSRSIIGFASNRNDLGKIILTRPVLRLETRDGGSNLEDLIARIAAAAAAAPLPPNVPDGSNARKTVEVEIVDGQVHGRDLATGQHWRIEGLTLAARPIAQGEAWDITAEGVMALAAAPATSVPSSLTPVAAGQRPPGGVPSDSGFPTGAQAGHFKLHLYPAAAGGGVAPVGSGTSAAPSRQRVDVIADRLPLAPLEPWLARVVPAARLTGDASADLQITWLSPTVTSSPGGAGDFQDVAAAGKLNSTNLRFTSAALSGDLLELPTAAIALDAAYADGRLTARNCTATSDWLQAQLNGEFNLAEISALSLKSLPTSDAVVTARADLPRLTRMLPRTLQLREGVRIDAGNIEITARSSKEAGGRLWTVAASLVDLIGSDGSRPIRWTQPIEFVVDAGESAAGPQLQRAFVRSAFASISADGTAGGLEGTMQFDLNELANQLGQFKDLSAWKLAGTGGGQFSLRDTGEGLFAASADLNLKQIDVQRDGKVVWQDPELRVELSANGTRTNLSPSRIDSGTITMRGPSDRLTAELQEPIDLTNFNTTWLVKLTGSGPLELWAGRLRPWVAGIPEQIAGQSTISAQVRARDGLLHVIESQLDVQNLRAQVGTTVIEEQQLKAAGDFRWSRTDRALESTDLQFSSNTVAARARGVSVQLADAGPPIARGEIAFRGDLERMSAWGIVFGAAQDGLRPRGQTVGRLQLTSDATRAIANLSLTAEPFQLVNSADGSLAWNEPRMELTTEAVYATADDRLQLANTRVTGQTVQLTGAGVIEQFSTAGLVRGDVNISYDAAELGTLLSAYLGPNVQIQGANTARLQATGRLYADAGEAPAAGGALPQAPAQLASTSAENTWNANSAASNGEAGGSQPSGLQPPVSSLSHWSRRWQVTTETGWSAANLYGLPIGAARVTTNVRDGQMQFTPLDLSVGQGGRISLLPRVTLDPLPQVLELAPGQLISNVAISAEVSERMLKYAAPILAGATRTEGSFSFFMENAQIPLRQPKTGRLSGRLTIHKLAVLPGPMVQSIAGLIRQVEALGKGAQGGQNLGLGLLDGLVPQNQPAQPLKGITMTERAIDIQVADGRVHHRNLEFLVDDVPVRSSGSVGFDESLALVIEVPIQQKWVGNKPALQGLVGQVMQIPVHGTFAQPKVDERAITGFVGQAAQAAAGGILGGELNKALDKLLKPR